MAHGLNSILKREKTAGGGIGSRRIFAPHFKLQVLDSYRNDADCKGNQRATARKYGIHRRQIQKWLQVEGTLRSSVASGKPTTRLPDDSSTPITPLDFTTTRDIVPIDLSLKRSVPPSPPLSIPLRVPTPNVPEHSQDNVWDLSTKRKRSENDVAESKPVKLFKPYLDDDEEQWKKHNEDSSTFRTSQDLPPCCAQAIPCDASYFYNNNNVVTCDIKSEYAPSYTIQELQPKGAPPTPPTYYYPFPSYPEYEISPFYENAMIPMKQRHSYSLDFKLNAIESYYQDSVCKGNQRAVAIKYNIHRRQVQKWLKQADELRQKNETIKHTEMVK